MYTGTLPDSEKAKVKTYFPPPSEEKAATEAVAGGGEDGKEEETRAEEKAVAAAAGGGGGGSRPRKTLPGVDPEEALRAFAESVGMSVDATTGAWGLPDSETAKVKTYHPPPSQEKAAPEVVAEGGEDGKEGEERSDADPPPASIPQGSRGSNCRGGELGVGGGMGDVMAEVAAVVRSAARSVCPQYADAARFTAKPAGKRMAGDVTCDAPAQLFFTHLRNQRGQSGQILLPEQKQKQDESAGGSGSVAWAAASETGETDAADAVDTTDAAVAAVTATPPRQRPTRAERREQKKRGKAAFRKLTKGDPCGRSPGTTTEVVGGAGDSTSGGAAAAPAGTGEQTVVVVSSYGIERRVTCRELAHLLATAVEDEMGESGGGVGGASVVHAVQVAVGPSGALLMTTRRGLQTSMAGGLVPCPRCGRMVNTATQGLEWHLKTAHGLTEHATAAEESRVAKSLALMTMNTHAGNAHHHGSDGGGDGGGTGATAHMYGAAAVAGGGGGAPPASSSGGAALAPSDLAEAQRDRGTLVRMIEEGRVKSLGPLLDACRCGDLRTVRVLVEEQGVDPAAGGVGAVDRHGSGALLWAAGGGHLEMCRYLVDRCGLDPRGGADRRARRGYSGRTALHWGARNGHTGVVRWLVEEVGVDVDRGTKDGTTALCWAAWQGQVEVCEYLVGGAGADPHTVNSYGCNAAMWAAQGAQLPTCRYLRTLGVDFSRLNANGQGCLHKAAQRGAREVCEWLVGEAAIGEARAGGTGGTKEAGGAGGASREGAIGGGGEEEAGANGKCGGACVGASANAGGAPTSHAGTLGPSGGGGHFEVNGAKRMGAGAPSQLAFFAGEPELAAWLKEREDAYAAGMAVARGVGEEAGGEIVGEKG